MEGIGLRPHSHWKWSLWLQIRYEHNPVPCRPVSMRWNTHLHTTKTKIPPPSLKTHKKPSSTWAAWENPFRPAKYSTFASPERKSLAYSEGRTDDLPFRLGNFQEFYRKEGELTDWATLTRLLRKGVFEKTI
jgi:hypothetical protein